MNPSNKLLIKDNSTTGYEIHDQVYDNIGETKNSRKLEIYHHIMDNTMDPESKDVSNDVYVWKVDRIISRKRRGRQIFLHVQWKPGNRSWISLESLRHHDPYACVIYAVQHKLFREPEWNWTLDVMC